MGHGTDAETEQRIHAISVYDNHLDFLNRFKPSTKALLVLLKHGICHQFNFTLRGDNKISSIIFQTYLQLQFILSYSGVNRVAVGLQISSLRFSGKILHFATDCIHR